MIETLTDESCFVRAAVAEALGRLGEKRAVEPLISLATDPSHFVRAAVAEALGKLQDRQAVQPLISLLSDHHPHVRLASIRALGGLPDQRSLSALQWVQQNDTGIVDNTMLAEEAGRTISLWNSEGMI